MSGDDPMLGSDEERKAYVQKIDDMIQADIEQRRRQRVAEFLKTRETPAVLQGSTGSPGGFIQAIDDG